MRITKMCPKCGSVIGREDDKCEHKSDTCQYCHIKRIDIDFGAEELHNTPTTEFDIVEQRINRKFLFQLPTFDESAYEARLKKEKEAEENLNRMSADFERERANRPKCPICGSPKIHKISLTNKAVGVALFGIFSAGHVSKTFKCDNCGAKF